jgi:hypothetical protein
MQLHNFNAPPGRFVSQSECGTALACGLQWFGTWHLGYRPQYPENMPQRVGSMGHAVLNDRVHAIFSNRDSHPYNAADDEREKRGWGPWTDDFKAEFHQAEQAADTLAEAVGLDRMRIVPNTVTADGGPLAEVRVHATWEMLARGGHSGDVFRGLDHLIRAYAGMEGQPDINVFMAATGDDVVTYDFKMRQKPDLGGAHDDSNLPDPQGAFYKVLLRAVGVPVQEFKQINVYAGPWLSLDDFMAEGSPYVRDDGLPSMSLQRLNAMVKPTVWADAWRLLVERKRVAHSLRPVKMNSRTGKPCAGQEWKAPDEFDARSFIRSLETYPLVSVRSFRLDMSVCRDIVRDMLGAVDAQLAVVAKGVTPSRNLRIFQTSPCVKKYGCPVQDQCRSAMGTGNAEQVMREQAATGALTQRSNTPLGVMPVMAKAVA